MSNIRSFSVLGAGSWGTAIASFLARVSGKVFLYTIDPVIANEINTENKNSKYLPNVTLPAEITATTSIEDSLKADIIVISVPSFAFSNIMGQLKERKLDSDKFLLIATKGLAEEPIELFSSRIKNDCSNDFGFLSGPNLAKEVALGKLSAVTISCENTVKAQDIANIIASDQIKTSVTDDIITAQIAAIVKNIVAIKSGIMKSEGQGENARAYLISQALTEIALIANVFGGKKESLALPSVVGDLVLTCYSDNSRNTKFGYEFHQNNFSKKFRDNYPVLVEGVNSARLLKRFIEPFSLDIPIINSIVELVS